MSGSSNRFALSSNGALIARIGPSPSEESEIEIFLDGKLVDTVRFDALSESPISTISRFGSADFSTSAPGWVIETEADAVPVAVNVLPEWTLRGEGTAYFRSIAAIGEGETRAIFECPVEGRLIKAKAGETHTLSALTGLHRCTGHASISFYDGAGRLLKQFRSDIEEDVEGGDAATDYCPVRVHATAPVGTTAMRVEFVKSPTLIGDDSFLFFARPALLRGEIDPVRSHPRLDGFNLEQTAEIMSAPAGQVSVRRNALSAQYFDDEHHDLRLVERATGDVVSQPAGGVLLRAAYDVVLFGLQGATIIGEIRDLRQPLDVIELALRIDGHQVDLQTILEPESGKGLRLPLPARFCDDRPHLFEVADTATGRILHRFADFAPDTLTPWRAIVQHARTPLPISRAPAMERRYRALSESLAAIAADDSIDATEKSGRICQLSLAHEMVVGGFETKRFEYPGLRFAPVEAPKVTVVIPVHNKFAVTYNCLAALILAHNRASFDVVVVDDGSSDETLDLHQVVQGLTIVRNPKALGFVGACNAGAAEARGEYIVFLNNDTEPTSGWLDELLFAFESLDNVGMAGSKLLFGDGSLQEAGGIVWETGDPWNYGRGNNPRDPRFCYTREVDYVSGAALMIPSALWAEVGGFSLELAPAYFEDVDLAFKVKNSGRRVVMAPFSVVYHFEGLSNGTDVTSTSGLKRFQEINRPKFKRKWVDLYKNNGPLGVDPDLAKDRGVSKRALFIDADTPRIDNDAGSYAAIQEMRLLQSLGCKVTFAPANLAYIGRHTENLQRMGVEVVYAPFVGSLEELLKARGSEFDLVYVARYQVGAAVIDAVREYCPRARMALSVVDLHFLRSLRERIMENARAPQLEQTLAMRKAELDLLSEVDLALTYSPVEEAVLTSHLLGRPPSGQIPWVLTTTEERPDFDDRRDVAFLGGFAHPPNVGAVEFFAKQVMPLLREKAPGIVFNVYGSSLPDSIRDLETDDIVMKGFVNDISEVFDTCRIFVAPLLYGAGVKGKVLDCIAAAVPSVISSVAAEGVLGHDSSASIIADTPEEWAEAIASLYKDKKRWRQMSEAAAKLAREKYSFEAGRQQMRSLLEAIDIFTPATGGALHATSSRPIIKS